MENTLAVSVKCPGSLVKSKKVTLGWFVHSSLHGV